jgi:hypothetical protein
MCRLLSSEAMYDYKINPLGQWPNLNKSLRQTRYGSIITNMMPHSMAGGSRILVAIQSIITYIPISSFPTSPGYNSHPKYD